MKFSLKPVALATLAFALAGFALSASAQWSPPAYRFPPRPACKTVAINQDGHMVATRFCLNAYGQWVAAPLPQRSNIPDRPIVPPGLDPSLAQLPPGKNGPDPSDCRVEKVESAGFVTVFCRTEKGMENYGATCCIKTDGLGGHNLGYEFSTLTVQALARRQAPVQAPPIDTPMSGDDAYKIALAYENHLPRDPVAIMRWYEKAARGDNFWAMIHVANEYLHYAPSYGISEDLGRRRSSYWVAKARAHARSSGLQREADELRNVFPLPGQTTDYERFNRTLSAAVQAEHQADVQARACQQQVMSRTHTVAELEDCGAPD